jgi:hypothetical protein
MDLLSDGTRCLLHVVQLGIQVPGADIATMQQQIACVVRKGRRVRLLQMLRRQRGSRV